MTTTPLEAPAEYAPLGKRVAARLVDAAIAIPLYVVAGLLMVVLARNGGAGALIGTLVYWGVVVGWFVFLVWLLATKGHTPGKKLLGLAVLDPDARTPIGFGRAFVRELVVGVLGCINLVQLFLIPQHARKQGWHDMAARSVVLTGAAGVPGSAAGPVLPPRPAAPPQASLATGAAPAAPASAPVPASPARPMTAPITPTTSTAGIAAPPGMIAPPPVVGPPPTPSAPAAAPTPPAPPAPSEPPVGGTSDEVDTHTRVVQRGRAWALQTTLGTEHTITGLVLIGRDPDATLVEGAGRWALDDPELSVSKTHALVGLDAGTPWIEDWHSTNGVLLRREGQETELPPHTRTPLQAGDEIELGEFVLTVKD